MSVLPPTQSLNSQVSATLNRIKPSSKVNVDSGLKQPGSPVNERQEALKGKLGEINQFGKRATNLFNQAVSKQKQIKAEEEARRQAEEARKQQRLSIQNQRFGTPPNINTNFSKTVGGIRGQILDYASGMIGTPYAWGGGGIGIRSSRGTGKGTQNVIGVDCSGLTSYVYGLVGIKLPRQSDAQTYQGVRTSLANARPGDLIGWNRGGHVAIYVGNGMMIESPKPGGHVRYTSIWDAGNAYAVRLNLPGD